LVIALLQTQDPRLATTNIVIGLKQIEAGSAVLVFDTSHPSQTQVVMPQIAAALQTGAFGRLPKSVRRGLLDLQKFARRHQVALAFADRQDGQRQWLGHLAVNTPIYNADQLIQERDTLYGVVVRVGGEHPPRVQLRLLDGETLSCRLTARENRHMAKELGRRLYQMVAVEGIAKRDIEDMSLMEFTIDGLGSYQETSGTQALANLNAVLWPYIEALGGPEAYLAHARQFDEGESQ
jgi:hypothetical protein